MSEIIVLRPFEFLAASNHTKSYEMTAFKLDSKPYKGVILKNNFSDNEIT